MTDFKGHNHGEYNDDCPICYLDAEVERQQVIIDRVALLRLDLEVENKRLSAENERLRQESDYYEGLEEGIKVGRKEMSAENSLKDAVIDALLAVKEKQKMYEPIESLEGWFHVEKALAALFSTEHAFFERSKKKFGKAYKALAGTEQKSKALDKSLRERINRGLYPDVCPETAIQKDSTQNGNKDTTTTTSFCGRCGNEIWPHKECGCV